jgi:hypothetical protein
MPIPVPRTSLILLASCPVRALLEGDYPRLDRSRTRLLRRAKQAALALCVGNAAFCLVIDAKPARCAEHFGLNIRDGVVGIENKFGFIFVPKHIAIANSTQDIKILLTAGRQNFPCVFRESVGRTLVSDYATFFASGSERYPSSVFHVDGNESRAAGVANGPRCDGTNSPNVIKCDRGLSGIENFDDDSRSALVPFKVSLAGMNIGPQLVFGGLSGISDELIGDVPKADRSQEQQKLAGFHSINLVSVAVSAGLLWLANWLYLSGRSVLGVGMALYAFGGPLFRVDPFSLLEMLR